MNCMKCRLRAYCYIIGNSVDWWRGFKGGYKRLENQTSYETAEILNVEHTALLWYMHVMCKLIRWCSSSSYEDFDMNAE